MCSGDCMKLFRSLRDFLWDKLFLDFYLDDYWTVRFRLMNLISGDELRRSLTSAHIHANRMKEDGDGDLHRKRTEYWVNHMWDMFTK